jgi:hypothetical protein
MNYHTAFKGKFFRASDVMAGPIFGTIKHVGMEKVGDDPTPKLVITFSNQTQRLVVNKTNGDKIAELIGTDETGSWHGAEIALVHARASFGPRTVDAVRVESPAVARRRTEAKQLDDAIPF